MNGRCGVYLVTVEAIRPTTVLVVKSRILICTLYPILCVNMMADLENGRVLSEINDNRQYALLLLLLFVDRSNGSRARSNMRNQ